MQLIELWRKYYQARAKRKVARAVKCSRGAQTDSSQKQIRSENREDAQSRRRHAGSKRSRARVSPDLYEWQIVENRPGGLVLRVKVQRCHANGIRAEEIIDAGNFCRVGEVARYNWIGDVVNDIRSDIRRYGLHLDGNRLEGEH